MRQAAQTELEATRAGARFLANAEVGKQNFSDSRRTFEARDAFLRQVGRNVGDNNTLIENDDPVRCIAAMPNPRSNQGLAEVKFRRGVDDRFGIKPVSSVEIRQVASLSETVGA